MSTERKFTKVVAPKLVKWERVGEKVEGIYDGLTEEEIKRKGDTFTGRTHTVLTDSGERINFYEPSDLGIKMREVKVGSYIRVTFVKEEKPVKRNYSPQKIFEVEVAD